MNRRLASKFTTITFALCATAVLCAHVGAAEPQGTHHHAVPSADAPLDGSAGGVLAESYQYHRQGYANGRPAHPTIAPAAGWYGYGFPVQTHRWGWFGAERYNPHVVWHRGYYGDCCRWAYRSGY
jgi:hypothetical protein